MTVAKLKLSDYYEVLEQSSQRWHQGKHDARPTLNFLLFILTKACKEFEQRLGQIKSLRGEKTALVEDAIARQTGAFSLSDLQQACPGVSADLILDKKATTEGSLPLGLPKVGSVNGS